MKEEKTKVETTEAYPKPSQADNQLKNQPEYINEQPSSLDDEDANDSEETSGLIKDSEKGGE